MADSLHVIEVTAESFQRVVVEGSYERPVLVDFWADWCAPCRVMASAFEKAARALEPWARLAKVNTEEDQIMATRLGIRSIPTLILFLFKDGRERTTGALDADRLVAWIRQWL